MGSRSGSTIGKNPGEFQPRIKIADRIANRKSPSNRDRDRVPVQRAEKPLDAATKIGTRVGRRANNHPRNDVRDAATKGAAKAESGRIAAKLLESSRRRKVADETPTTPTNSIVAPCTRAGRVILRVTVTPREIELADPIILSLNISDGKHTDSRQLA